MGDIYYILIYIIYVCVIYVYILYNIYFFIYKTSKDTMKMNLPEQKQTTNVFKEA